MRRMGENGLRAARKTFNRDAETAKLVEAYARFETDCNREESRR